MNRIKFYKIRPFEFKESLLKRRTDPNTGESYVERIYITHKIKGDVVKLNGEVYFGFDLDIPPAAPDVPASEVKNHPENASDAECDDARFYLRKGSNRTKTSDGEIIDYYQEHVIDFFNYKGLTYIKFVDDFAAGKFTKAAEKINSRSKSMETHNLYYKQDQFLKDMSWL